MASWSLDPRQLDEWANCLSELAPTYRNSTMLGHYRRLYQQFCQAGFSDLALAGFFHGVRDLDTVAGFIDPDLRTSVIGTLEDWRRLRAFSSADSSLPINLASHILPSMTYPRAAALAVVEAIDQLDPHGAIAAHTRAFHRELAARPSVPLEDLPLRSADRLAEKVAYTAVVATQAAEFCGLWFQRNVARDVALFYQERERFRVACEYRRAFDEEASILAREIAARLPSFVTRWEWHHVTAVSDAIRRESVVRLPPERLTACGTVNIICPDVRQCYVALGELHHAFWHQTLDIRDTLGQPIRSGFEAIETRVRCASGQVARVRIIPEQVYAATYQTLDRRLLNGLAPRKAESQNTLRVYAFDGKQVDLPPGATVLNFCKSVHQSLVAHAETAVVNGESVGLLHKLRSGDVVRVVVADEPRQRLPSGWEATVPPGTGWGLRRAFRLFSQPPQMRKGREQLRRFAAKQIPGIEFLDEAAFDSFLEECLTPAQTRGGLGALYWAVSKDELTGLELNSIVRRLYTAMQRGDQVAIDLFETPAEFLSRYDVIRFCHYCKPKVGDEVDGAITSDRTLWVHRRDVKCVADALRLNWRRYLSRGQYFTLEMDRSATALMAVFDCARQRDIRIIEHAGSGLAAGWTVLRLHVESMLGRQVERFAEALEAIPGVLRVTRPNDPVDPFVEGHLPRRAPLRDPRADVSDLFLYGPPVRDERRFYGREYELGKLQDAYNEAVSRGVFVLVSGPHKIGKSSLVHHFMDRCKKKDSDFGGVRVSVGLGMRWASHDNPEYNILPKIEEQLRDLAKALDIENSDHRSSLELLRLLTSRSRRIVLFIDEGVYLIAGPGDTDKDQKDCEAFLSWLAVVKRMPNVTTILAGPSERFMDISTVIANRLATARPVKVLPMKSHEIRALLQARNFDFRSSGFHVPEAVARRACEDTNGNPYWCNALASLFSGNQGSRTVFDQGAYETACNDVQKDGVLFLDRFSGPGGVDMRIVRVLLSLAKSTSGTPLPQLLQLLYDEFSDKDLAGTMIARLESRGAIRLDTESSVWHIDCRMLANHIIKRYRSEAESGL